jgi:hypothetical protein
MPTTFASEGPSLVHPGGEQEEVSAGDGVDGESRLGTESDEIG